MITADKMHDNTMSLKAREFTANLGNTSNDDVKECAMMGLIKNQKIDLEERLNNAKLKFADANLVKDNWSCAKEREIDCKVLEGQIFILSKIERDLEDMLTPAKMPPD